jgi:hypothetical protein
MSWLALVGLGFLLGLKHALDADHVVAVSTIVSRHRKLSKASLVGALWGLGHTTTLFGVGVAVLTFRLTIPERVALVFELLVGVVLIGLGSRCCGICADGAFTPTCTGTAGMSTGTCTPMRARRGTSTLMGSAWVCARSWWGWCTGWRAARL